MWPEDDEVSSIGKTEYCFPDLFSDFFEYHIEQMSRCSMLSKKSIVDESEVREVDMRYCYLYSPVDKYVIYQIVSKNCKRFYIGYTTKSVLHRFCEHYEDMITGCSVLSSIKVLLHGDSRIETLYVDDFVSERDCKVKEGEFMRKYIDSIVNWKKECRSSEERMKDFASGIELRYYLDVDLSGSQETRKIGSLSRYYAKNRFKVKMNIPDDENSKAKAKKILEGIEDINQLKYIKKRIKDPKLAREELRQRKEMCEWLENWDGNLESLKSV